MLSLFSGLSDKNKDRIVNLTVIGSMILVAMFLLIPLFRQGITGGDDFAYHIYRIEGLAESFKNHAAFIGIRTNFLNGYGYGTGFFYCDFFIILPAFLRSVGVSIETSYKVLQATLIVSVLLVSWLCFKEISKNKIAAVVGAILYTGSHYFILNLYTRSAIGETTAMIFLPVVAAGLCNLVRENYSKPYILTIGMVGVCLSHLISTIFCLTLCIIVFLIHIKKIWKPEVISRLVSSVFFALGMTAFFWLPMLEQKMIQHYRVEYPWVRPYQECVPLMEVLGNGRYSIGYFLVVCVCMVMLLAGKKCFQRIIPYFSSAAAGIILLTIPAFWKVFDKVLGFMQFPWRILGLITLALIICVTLVTAQMFKDLTSRRRVAVAFLIVLSLLNIEMNLEYFRTKTDDLLYIDENNIKDIPSTMGGGCEWLPIEVDESQSTMGEVAVSASGLTHVGQKDGVKFSVNLNEETEYIIVPFVYYKGYQASNLTQKCSLKVEKADNGLLKVNTEDAKENDIILVEYEETLLSRIGRIISIFSAISYIVYIIMSKMVGIKKNEI